MTPFDAIEVMPRDLSAYRQGNTGVDYVHRFESGRPGPHVLINALTHGNEFCGMTVVTHLLDTHMRPLIGTLTLSFANVQAYESFDPAQPFASRQIVHNMNRIWSAEQLDGPEDSPELRRARAMREVVQAADHVLDIHSTAQDVEPFWVYPAFERNGQVALSVGVPQIHLVMPNGLGSGTPLIQFGAFGTPQHHGAAMVVECGQHFKTTTGEVALASTLGFLAHFGLIALPEAALRLPAKRFELLQTCMITSPDFRFVKPVKGFEVFAQGELIATQGGQEIRALCDDCTILMPAREAIVGREAVYLAKPI
jgi:predicted deacylase